MSRSDERLERNTPSKIPRFVPGAKGTTAFNQEIIESLTLSETDPEKASEAIELLVHTGETTIKVRGMVEPITSLVDILRHAKEASKLQSLVVFDRHRALIVTNDNWQDSWRRNQSFRIYPSYLLRTATLTWKRDTIPANCAEARTQSFVKEYPPDSDLRDIVPQLHNGLTLNTFVSSMYIFVKMSDFEVEAGPHTWMNLQEVPASHRTLKHGNIRIQAVWPPSCALGDPPMLRNRVSPLNPSKWSVQSVPTEGKESLFGKRSTSDVQRPIKAPSKRNFQSHNTKCLTSSAQDKIKEPKQNKAEKSAENLPNTPAGRMPFPSLYLSKGSFAEYWKEVTWDKALAIEGQQPLGQVTGSKTKSTSYQRIRTVKTDDEDLLASIEDLSKYFERLSKELGVNSSNFLTPEANKPSKGPLPEEPVCQSPSEHSFENQTAADKSNCPKCGNIFGSATCRSSTSAEELENVSANFVPTESTYQISQELLSTPNPNDVNNERLVADEIALYKTAVAFWICTVAFLFLILLVLWWTLVYPEMPDVVVPLLRRLIEKIMGSDN